MSLIHEFMPDFSLCEVDRVAVSASPEQAWAAVRAMDIYRVPFIRWLFSLRVLPERILARLRGRPMPKVAHSRIEDIVAPGTGFLLLGEKPGQELVVGSIGRFWQPRIEFAKVAPGDFAAFQEPGFGKLTWNLSVQPREGGGSWIGIELRVTAMDAASWTRFRRYWGLIGRFSQAIRRGGLRLLRRELGRVPTARKELLPGDGLLPRARFQRTRWWCGCARTTARARAWPS